ncbi:hypothetical protein HF086_002007 [Spodoptera exigua]|nr:hypothetical protein HF086_002007 [Spodoptera exigua]
MELRRNLLTASNFGKIVKRKRTNSCANTVKNMLYKPDIGHVASINHGRTHEKVALEQLSKLLKVTIDPCGLYIDKTHPFLGATPDGIIENNTLVEIKCPVIPFKIGIEAAISQGKMHLWRINKKTGDIVINKMSDWYMQVQGQMHVCDVPKCILAVWYGDNQIKVEEIFKDDEFWTDKMEPKLISFYFDCLLPELVDPRHTRKLPIREPNYVNISKNKENLNDRESMTEEPINVISEIQFSQF